MTACNAPETLYSKRMWKEKGVNTPVRCKHCGRPHVRGEPISPEMLPLGHGVKLSPWYPHMYRPHLQGYYNCRFRSIEPQVVQLWWDGVRFTHGGRKVRMGDFLGYQGSWR